ncbi:Protein of unknown function [Rhodococcus rhodochrous J3]|uniref:Uncharacterized protein DUF3349 n=6 Tax=Rhodococcus TaxID=1827 RepID=A0A562D9J1_RHORH|nr:MULTISPECIES: DUF3349 domain-containing protein [Rhodococcus]AOD20403.1 hypothetical protein IM25_01075 [Rhodococcus sp. p52]AWZ26168.1 hypothetical protein CEJ39_20125 [Rhodococcus pyridinivorans]AYA23558.1 DUF3349 domain-containing protein [Rhodococcus rhodochrous]EHK83474.1 hypothetical protein AK37_11776 [Rhodococcus pyridinivorans AK37]KHJ72222.1 hypothetical protein QR64_12435 [Rhodococcus sp. Chr-9]
MALPPFLASIVEWLRAGYPEGVPEQDYVPLFALLARRLSDEEVAQVADTLVEDGDLSINRIDIAVLISKITNNMPSPDDVDRVRRQLEAGGWDTTQYDL